MTGRKISRFRRFVPFGVAAVSFALYAAALPAPFPAFWAKYAIFFVPALWAFLILRGDSFENPVAETPKRRRCVRRLAGRFAALFFGGPFRQYWTAAFLFWLATVVWVSYPHPATTFGWLALAGYLAFYFPFFIGIARTATRRFRTPIWAAAPIAWTAIEWVRNRALGGFSFAGLSHALFDSPYLTQIAEPLGEYGLGATIVFVGTLLGSTVFGRKRADKAPWRNGATWGFRFDARPLLVAAAALGATLYFGKTRVDFFDGLERSALERGEQPFRIALLQDGTTYRFPVPEFESQKVDETYLALAAESSRTEPRFDAIVWPESCFAGFYCDFSSAAGPAPRDGAAPVRNGAFDVATERAALAARRRSLARLTSRLDAAAILGTTSIVFDATGAASFYNSAVFVPRFGDDATVAALPDATFSATPTNASTTPDAALAFRRYDKIRLVMFGEYIPFVEYLPDWFPLKAVCADFALDRGAGPVAFELARRDGANASSRPLILAPNVCFESSIPQYVAAQVRELTAAGAAPDVLVNVSNDGWFRNGIQTDMHLATQVFRALENRKSVVSATHGGFSAWVDPAGRVRARGARGETQVVAAEILPIRYARSPIYWGELFAAICAAFGGVALGFEAATKISRKKR